MIALACCIVQFDVLKDVKKRERERDVGRKKVRKGRVNRVDDIYSQ